LYGNIISENKDNIKSQKIFFAVYGVADETIRTQAVLAVAVNPEYAGGDVNTAYIQMVSCPAGENITELILLFAELHSDAAGKVRGSDAKESSRSDRPETDEITSVIAVRRYASSEVRNEVRVLRDDIRPFQTGGFVIPERPLLRGVGSVRSCKG